MKTHKKGKHRHRNKPWRNNDGSFRFDTEIKEISRNWKQANWNKYLVDGCEPNMKHRFTEVPVGNLIETGSFDPEDPEKAQQYGLSSKELDSLSSSLISESPWKTKTSDTFFERPQIKSLKSRLHESLKSLTDIEKEIIRLRYWQDISFYKIARMLKTRKSSILIMHSYALAKLKENLTDK